MATETGAKESAASERATGESGFASLRLVTLRVEKVRWLVVVVVGMAGYPGA